MATKEDILNLLKANRDKELSGQHIADELNISRAAVWKAVNALRECGYEISAVTNRGYRLEREPDDFDENIVRSYMYESQRDILLTVVSTVDSTNTRLKMMAQQGAPHKSVLISQEQTAGKGQKGRSFFSPAYSGIYMSVLFRPEGSIEEAQMVTVMAAVAVCRAIERLTSNKPQIKWVNDIYCGGKKVCGILTEAGFDIEGGRIDYLISGIGINCTTKREEFPEEIRDTAGSIELAEGMGARLAAVVASELLELYENGSGIVMDEYRRYSMMIGKHISYQNADGTMRAVVKSINDRGNLVVVTADGEEKTLFSGEVTILKDFLYE